MFVISSVGAKLLEKLRKKAYRHAYLAQHVRRGIAYQIRALRDQRGWKQGEFAKELGKPQSVAHRLEDPDYGKYTLQTLLEVAHVFDVALEVRFVSYSTFICNTRDVSAPSMETPSFADDLGMMGLSQGTQSIIVSAGAVTQCIVDPTYIEQHANSFVFIDAESSNWSGDSLRIPVRIVEGTSGRIATVFFATPSNPNIVWRRS